MSKISRLIETTTITAGSYRKMDSLSEATRTVKVNEASGTITEYKAKGVYTFPISRPDKLNLNSRLYSSGLWEKQIKRLMNQSTYGLMDHPEQEGSTRDIWCVWRNLRFSEDRSLIVADAYLVGSYGSDVLEMLEAGGEIGLSTSGFGELMEDSKTVDPQTYELERVADFVFNPSAQVFGKSGDVIANEEVTPVEEVAPVLDEETKIDNSVDVKEKDSMLDTLEKKPSLEERGFILNMRSLFKEAKAQDTLDQRISAYNDLLQYLEDGTAPEIKKELTEALAECLTQKDEFAKKGETVDTILVEKTTLSEGLAAVKAELELVKTANKDLESQLTAAAELLESLKVYTNKLKEMYEVAKAEKNGMVPATEFKETLAWGEQMEQEKTELEHELRELKHTSAIARVPEKVVVVPEVVEEHTEVVAPIINAVPGVLRYYEDLVYAVPDVVIIKEDILGCRTVMEAQKKYMRLKPLLTPDTPEVKVTSEKNTYSDIVKRPLNRRDGWV